MEMISGSLLRKSCAKYVTNISFRFANKLERSYYAKTLLGVYNCTEKYKFCDNCRYLCHAQMVQDKCAKFFKKFQPNFHQDSQFIRYIKWSRQVE